MCRLYPQLYTGRKGEQRESGQGIGDSEGRSRERRPDRERQESGRETGARRGPEASGDDGPGTANEGEGRSCTRGTR